MNDKQSFINEVLDIIVECSSISVDGKNTITAEDILSQDRRESVTMARCIFVSQMLFCGYSRTTIGAVLHRGEKSINNMLALAHQYRKTSYAYRLAEAESTIRLKDLIYPDPEK